MPLITRANNATNESLRARVKMSIVGAAIAINGELQGANSVPVWDARRDLALNVLRNPEYFAALFVWGVASDPAIGDIAPGSVTDLQIDNRVSAIWSDYAVRN
jgi:hypothetical protein